MGPTTEGLGTIGGVFVCFTVVRVFTKVFCVLVLSSRLIDGSDVVFRRSYLF
jgi:hypothetical protein